jgi:DNA topoisomerase VI subunit A
MADFDAKHLFANAQAFSEDELVRQRRTKADMSRLRAFIYEVLANENPMTVRQVFYQATSAGVIRKTETEYNGVIVRLLKEMRLDGTIPFHWIADNTRWMRKPAYLLEP